jgi:hypothetical protein
MKRVKRKARKMAKKLVAAQALADMQAGPMAEPAE